MQDYKKLEVWQHAHKVSVSVYKMTMHFPKEEIFALTSQLRRAASSIPANIAEGCGRKSQAYFSNFLNIALGSTNETSYFFLLAKDIGYLTEESYKIYENEIERIKAMLISLISKTRKK
jgi:four helix bundle protein